MRAIKIGNRIKHLFKSACIALLLGVTGVGLNMEMVANLLQSYRQRYGRDIYLVDKNG